MFEMQSNFLGFFSGFSLTLSTLSLIPGCLSVCLSLLQQQTVLTESWTNAGAYTVRETNPPFKVTILIPLKISPKPGSGGARL